MDRKQEINLERPYLPQRYIKVCKNLHAYTCYSVVLVPQNQISLVLVLVLDFEIILVSISSSIPILQ